MTATLRTREIGRRRKRQEKRRKLRARLAYASAAERAALEARLQKTFASGGGEMQSNAAGAERRSGET